MEVTDDGLETSIIGGQFLQLQMRVGGGSLIQPVLELLQLSVLLRDDVAVVDVRLLHQVLDGVHLLVFLLQP